jgi:hypothetical protein
MTQQTQLVGWRARVRDWLAAVIRQQNQSFHRDFAQAANQLKSVFPKSFWIALAAQIVKPLAVLIVKSALRDASSDLGYSLDAETLDFLANLAVDVLVAP